MRWLLQATQNWSRVLPHGSLLPVLCSASMNMDEPSATCVESSHRIHHRKCAMLGLLLSLERKKQHVIMISCCHPNVAFKCWSRRDAHALCSKAVLSKRAKLPRTFLVANQRGQPQRVACSEQSPEIHVDVKKWFEPQNTKPQKELVCFNLLPASFRHRLLCQARRAWRSVAALEVFAFRSQLANGCTQSFLLFRPHAQKIALDISWCFRRPSGSTNFIFQFMQSLDSALEQTCKEQCLTAVTKAKERS